MALGFRMGAGGGGQPQIIPQGSTVIPTDDIQTWLHCANIWDKTYMSIGAVLGDTTTLSTLISDANAVDYMVRSTTWVSAVCANQTAMQYIGANNYASETLLADSTWCDALYASAYMTSVFNAINPQMTSNTSPSGTATASSYFDVHYAYKAFDKNINNGWEPSNGQYSGWVQYAYTTPVLLKRAYIEDLFSNRSGYNNTSYNLQGSNDGNNFTSLKTGSITAKNEGTSSNNITIKLASNTVKYKIYRLTISAANPILVTGGYDGGVDELFLYARKDV